MWGRLYNPLIALLVFGTVIALFFITPFALHRELGFGGLVLGTFTVCLLIIEGGPGPITQLAASIAIFLTLLYLVYEWYVTSSFFT